MPDEPLSGYRGRRVLITGHNGFVGSWTTRRLDGLGAEVFGFSRSGRQPHAPMSEGVSVTFGDVSDRATVFEAMERYRPDIVLHLAAQPLVSEAVADPGTTVRANTLGTAHVLEAAVRTATVRSVVLMGTPGEPDQGVEDALDPYTASKTAGAALAAGFAHRATQRAAGRRSALHVRVVRPGVILGGDLTPGRLLPGVIDALNSGSPVRISRPGDRRPWQHVLDVAQEVLSAGLAAAGAPSSAPSFEIRNLTQKSSLATVQHLVSTFLRHWGKPEWPMEIPVEDQLAGVTDPPAGSAAPSSQGGPVWDLDGTVAAAAWWYRAVQEDPTARARATDRQIHLYASDLRRLAASRAAASTELRKEP